MPMLIIMFLISRVATDAPGVYNVLKSQTLGEPVELVPGSIYRINTGGTLPPGADTVIMVEDTRLVSAEKGPDGSDIEEKEVETLAQIPVGENVRAPGSDVRKGDLVLQEGDRISSGGGEIGTLAFVGRREVCVHKTDSGGQIEFQFSIAGICVQETYSCYLEYWE